MTPEQELHAIMFYTPIFLVIGLILLIVGMIGVIKTKYPEENKYDKRSLLFSVLTIFGLFLSEFTFTLLVIVPEHSLWLLSLTFIPAIVVFVIILFDTLKRQEKLYNRVKDVKQFRYVQRVFYYAPEYRVMFTVYTLLSMFAIVGICYLPSLKGSLLTILVWLLFGLLAYLIYSHIVGMLWRRAAKAGIIKSDDIHWRHMNLGQKLTRLGKIPADIAEDFKLRKDV